MVSIVKVGLMQIGWGVWLISLIRGVFLFSLKFGWSCNKLKEHNDRKQQSDNNQSIIISHYNKSFKLIFPLYKLESDEAGPTSQL